MSATSASDDQVTKKYQHVNDAQSAGCSEVFNESPQQLIETLSTDSKQREDCKASQRKRLYRERHREECKQRQQRYYERHKEELNKRKRERRRQQNGSQSTPATPAERNRRYRERNKQIINERRRLERNSQQVRAEYNINNISSNEEIAKMRVENAKTGDQRLCEEIPTAPLQDRLCDTSEVTVKIEQDIDGCCTEEQSEQNGDYINGLHEVDIKVQIISNIKLEPEIKLEVLEHLPLRLTETECPIFEPCTRQMLPRVDMFAIIQYFIQNGGIYEQLDFDKLKKDNDDLYADDSIDHVQIHRHKAGVTLQCAVAFNRTTSHTCLVKYSVYTRSVEWARCECGERACGHVVAFLMWIHRRAEERKDNIYL